jgi:hypothetical protein
MIALPATGHHSLVRCLRREIMESIGWSPRDLYRTLETPGANRLRDAHAALDSTVRAAYGLRDNEDTLAFLLRLNLKLVDDEANGRRISARGLPSFVPDQHCFNSSDCIQPNNAASRGAVGRGIGSEGGKAQ